jgi:hypothetical protein
MDILVLLFIITQSSFNYKIVFLVIDFRNCEKRLIAVTSTTILTGPDQLDENETKIDYNS